MIEVRIDQHALPPQVQCAVASDSSESTGQPTNVRALPRPAVVPAATASSRRFARVPGTQRRHRALPAGGGRVRTHALRHRTRRCCLRSPPRSRRRRARPRLGPRHGDGWTLAPSTATSHARATSSIRATAASSSSPSPRGAHPGDADAAADALRRCWRRHARRSGGRGARCLPRRLARTRGRSRCARCAQGRTRWPPDARGGRRTVPPLALRRGRRRAAAAAGPPPGPAGGRGRRPRGGITRLLHAMISHGVLPGPAVLSSISPGRCTSPTSRPPERSASTPGRRPPRRSTRPRALCATPAYVPAPRCADGIEPGPLVPRRYHRAIPHSPNLHSPFPYPSSDMRAGKPVRGWARSSTTVSA